MQEEIFGPVLPILKFSTVEEVIGIVNSRDQPLTVYYFGDTNGDFGKTLKRNTISGTFVTNEILPQMASAALPFGGVGASGCGRYKGLEGFNQMSNMRSVFERPNTKWDDPSFRYPNPKVTGEQKIVLTRRALPFITMNADRIMKNVKRTGKIFVAGFGLGLLYAKREVFLSKI
jgi:hypothetical protein